MNVSLISEILRSIDEQSKVFRRSVKLNPQTKTYLLSIENKISEALGLMQEQTTTDSPLSPKELEVLTLVSKGFTNKEIASALNVSHKTIEFHLSGIMRKTEASKRTEAVTNAIQKRWITP